jgi:hypothetical protein
LLATLKEEAVAQLAQSYIHLRPFRISQSNLHELGRTTDRIASEVAQRIYGPGIEVDVRLEEGSLKGWVTAIGTIVFGAYTGIASYKDFKDNIPVL